MNINVTIFIQIINFYIVYLLLRTFLFKPAIDIIDHELSDRAALTNLINQQKKDIEKYEKDREHYWNICREYFRNNRPKVAYQKVVIDTTIFEDEEIEKELTFYSNELISEVYKKLKEKIKNVH